MLQCTKKSLKSAFQAPICALQHRSKYMADQAVQTKLTEAGAETLRAAEVAKIVKPAARIAKPTVRTIKTGVKTMTTQNRKAADAGFAAAEQIKTVVTEANDRARTAMEKNAKIIEELAELSRGNVEAF